MARTVPGDSAEGVWLKVRVGGERTVGSEGRCLLPSDCGREMESSSSWIAEDILPVLHKAYTAYRCNECTSRPNDRVWERCFRWPLMLLTNNRCIGGGHGRYAGVAVGQNVSGEGTLDPCSMTFRSSQLIVRGREGGGRMDNAVKRRLCSMMLNRRLLKDW